MGKKKEEKVEKKETPKEVKMKFGHPVGPKFTPPKRANL